MTTFLIGGRRWDEDRIDEFNYSATSGSYYVKNIDSYFIYMIQYKHAKLLHQCVIFWPRNRLSKLNEWLLPPTRRPVYMGPIWGYFVYVSRHIGLHRQSNCIYILTMPCVDNISVWNHFDNAIDHRLGRTIWRWVQQTRHRCFRCHSLSKPENRTLLESLSD